MNAGPTSAFWFQLFGSLALEGSVVLIFALGLQRCARTAVWRRIIWQAALLGLGLMAVLELTGISRVTFGPPLQLDAYETKESFIGKAHQAVCSLREI